MDGTGTIINHGDTATARDLIAAIRTLNRIEQEGSCAAEDERAILARFPGFGCVALSLFLVLALMTLRLWELAGLALPMVAILVVQVAFIALVCLWPVFRVMWRDYEAAVMGGGMCGFMLGTAANAMANMEALVDRYGPAPRAFLVVPMSAPSSSTSSTPSSSRSA